MIFKVQDLQNGEVWNVDVMVEEELTPDEVRVVGVDMSDEDCLFGHYLDDGYWITLFENEGLDGVQKQLKTLEDLPEDELYDSIEDVFNASKMTEQEFITCLKNGNIKSIDDISKKADEECATTDASIINEFPYNQFFDYDAFGNWLVNREIDQGLAFRVGDNVYEILD